MINSRDEESNKKQEQQKIHEDIYKPLFNKFKKESEIFNIYLFIEKHKENTARLYQLYKTKPLLASEIIKRIKPIQDEFLQLVTNLYKYLKVNLKKTRSLPTQERLDRFNGLCALQGEILNFAGNIDDTFFLQILSLQDDIAKLMAENASFLNTLQDEDLEKAEEFYNIGIFNIRSFHFKNLGDNKSLSDFQKINILLSFTAFINKIQARHSRFKFNSSIPAQIYVLVELAKLYLNLNWTKDGYKLSHEILDLLSQFKKSNPNYLLPFNDLTSLISLLIKKYILISIPATIDLLKKAIAVNINSETTNTLTIVLEGIKKEYSDEIRSYAIKENNIKMDGEKISISIENKLIFKKLKESRAFQALDFKYENSCIIIESCLNIESTKLFIQFIEKINRITKETNAVIAVETTMNEVKEITDIKSSSDSKKDASIKKEEIIIDEPKISPQKIKEKKKGVPDPSKNKKSRKKDEAAKEEEEQEIETEITQPVFEGEFEKYNQYKLFTFFSSHGSKCEASTPKGMLWGYINEKKIGHKENALIEESQKVLEEGCMVFGENQKGIKPTKDGYKIKALKDKSITGKKLFETEARGKQVSVYEFDKVKTHNNPSFS